jgi:hypothetical protein
MMSSTTCFRLKIAMAVSMAEAHTTLYITSVALPRPRVGRMTPPAVYGT